MNGDIKHKPWCSLRNVSSYGGCDCGAAEIAIIVAERDALRAEVEALRRDAERWRYMRENYKYLRGWTEHGRLRIAREPQAWGDVSPEDADAAIDAAMASDQ